MNDTQHTEWGIGHGKNVSAIYASTDADSLVARCHGPEHKANAALIVKAVNAHADLLEALKGLLNFDLEPQDDLARRYIEAAKETVKRAEGIDPDYENAEAQREAN